jgi:hypothetical protein
MDEQEKHFENSEFALAFSTAIFIKVSSSYLIKSYVTSDTIDFDFPHQMEFVLII